VVLEIIRLSLELTLEVIKGIPIADRQKIWAEHQARMKFWTDLFEKLTPAKPGASVGPAA
jgi:hypothetical protein